MNNMAGLSFSVSATTRTKRAAEKDGVDYYFLTVEEFKQKIAANEFIEWEEVYHDKFYGTLKSEVERISAMNKTVIFDVDVEGGLNIKNSFGKSCLALFVKPPSMEILRQRLASRGTESEESLNKRIAKAEYELTYESKFDGVIVNDNFERACEQAQIMVARFINN